MSIKLESGYLFRTTDRHGNVVDVPFIGSAVQTRLKKHRKQLSLDGGETMHSFRSGCSITLSLLGISYSEVVKLIGWKSSDMAEYYRESDKVMSDNDASSMLSKSASMSLQGNSTTDNLGKAFRDRNFQRQKGLQATVLIILLNTYMMLQDIWDYIWNIYVWGFSF